MTHLLENIRCVNNFQLEEKGREKGERGRKRVLGCRACWV